MGGANVFGSFLDCYPCAASLSRSSLQEKVGCKSQLSSLMSSGYLVLVILFAGPLFYYLPKVSSDWLSLFLTRKLPSVLKYLSLRSTRSREHSTVPTQYSRPPFCAKGQRSRHSDENLELCCKRVKDNRVSATSHSMFIHLLVRVGPSTCAAKVSTRHRYHMRCSMS